MTRVTKTVKTEAVERKLNRTVDEVFIFMNTSYQIVNDCILKHSYVLLK